MKGFLMFMAGFACATVIITCLTVEEPLFIEDTVCRDNPTEQHSHYEVDISSEEGEDISSECFPIEVRKEDAIPSSSEKLSKLIDAPFIYQMEEYPNGCEAVSATMALQYFGYDMNVDSFIDEYLPTGEAPVVNGIGPDPALVYCGDPRSPYGWGCYSAVIEKALDNILDSSYMSVSSTEDSLEALCGKYIDNDIPVIIWATVAMEDSSDISYYRCWQTSDGKEIAYNSKLHCLLLVGYDEENYYFNDPYLRQGCGIGYPRESVEKAFSIMGNQSIVIMKR